MLGYDPDSDHHRFNPRAHYRLYLSHRGEGAIVICVQDFDYGDYDLNRILSNEAWDSEAEAEAACAKLRADLATTIN